jgi:hypothetical protein
MNAKQLRDLFKNARGVKVAGKFVVSGKQAPRPAKDIPTPGAVRTKRTGIRTIVLTEKDILP